MSETSSLNCYCSPRSGFPMRVSDSSVGGGVGQFPPRAGRWQWLPRASRVRRAERLWPSSARPIGIHCTLLLAGAIDLESAENHCRLDYLTAEKIFQARCVLKLLGYARTLKFTNFAKAWSQPKSGPCRESDIQRSRRGQSGRVSSAGNPDLPGLRHEVLDHWRYRVLPGLRPAWSGRP